MNEYSIDLFARIVSPPHIVTVYHSHRIVKVAPQIARLSSGGMLSIFRFSFRPGTLFVLAGSVGITT